VRTMFVETQYFLHNQFDLGDKNMCIESFIIVTYRVSVKKENKFFLIKFSVGI